MADSEPFNGPHFAAPQVGSPVQSKSYMHFLYKFLVVACVLLVLPLFPSEAPEFINQSIFTKFWELIHLLFIGVVVCYGLFSRRNVEMDIETHSNVDNSQSYLSRIFHVSSIFEDGVENPSGYDEKKMIQTWNSQYLRTESMAGFTNESCIVSEQSDPLLGFENTSLGLPVRRLQSRILEQGIRESLNGSGSNSRLKGFSQSSGRVGNGNFRELSQQNLDLNLRENNVLPSPIPWRSRSGRMELREEVGVVTPPDSTPISQEEFQFEPIKSRSFRSSSSSSSQTSSISSSPNKISPTSSVTSELPNSRKEELWEKKSCYVSASPTSLSPPTSMSGKADLISPTSCRYDNGSSLAFNVQRSFKDRSSDLNRGQKEDLLGSKESGLGSLKSGMKHEMIPKARSRGKSVRTIRASEPVMEEEARNHGEIPRSPEDDKVRKKHKKVESVVLMRKGDRETREYANLAVGRGKQDLDNPNPKPKPAFSKCQNGGKQEFYDNIIVDSAQSSERESDDFQVSSDEEVEVAGTDTNEVDRKAGEFIAKFREQIRLQRVAARR